jgi:hypothetical protein
MTFNELCEECDKLNDLTGRKFKVKGQNGMATLVDETGSAYCKWWLRNCDLAYWMDAMRCGFAIGLEKAARDEADELLFMVHDGTRIYNTWQHGHEQDPTSDYFYCFDDGGDPESPHAFDVRDLKPPATKKELRKYETLFPEKSEMEHGTVLHERVIAHALDSGQLDDYKPE